MISLSVCYSAGLEELESILEKKKNSTGQQTHSETTRNKCSYFSRLAYSAIQNISLATTTIKINVEYFFPFVSSLPSYLTKQAVSQAFSLCNSLLQYVVPDSRPVSYHKRQFWSLEKPYELDFKPNRKPILIHNMFVKFHPKDPHLLDHKELDFLACITPAEQTSSYGGELIFLDTSTVKGTAIHNPSLIEHKGKLYMTLRVQGQDSMPHWYAKTFLAEVTGDFQIISHYPVSLNNIKTHEDARLIIFRNNLYASYVTDVSYKFGFYNTCMEIGKFIPGNQIVAPTRPNIDDNICKDALQKNWLFFEKDERLLVISSIDPMVVYDATDDLQNPKEIVKKEKVIKDWPFGQVRSSTTPIWIEEHRKYLSFFHSHIITTDGIREYFLSALLFDNEFNITNYSKKPLFISTPHIKRFLGANTILPYGCIRQGDKLILSVGINDRAAAIIKLPVKRILETLKGL